MLPNRPLIAAGIVATLLALCPQRGRAQVDDPYDPYQPIGPSAGSLFYDGALFRFGMNAGQGLGADTASATAGVMLPLWLNEETLWFVDAQATNFAPNDQGGAFRPAANLGFGYRQPTPLPDTFLGFSGWLDYNAVHRNSYYQGSTGVELLHPRFDGRANLYVPFGTTKNLVSDLGFSSPFFRAHDILFVHSQIDERAFRGGDAEIGYRILGNYTDLNVQGYVGGYQYRAERSDSALGMSGRIVTNFTPSMSLQVAVTNDSLFDTNVLFGFTWFFPGGPRRNGEAISPLLQPVRRNSNIVVRDVLIRDDILATNAATGLPFHVVHVNSAAAPGGNGTVEMPFQTLAGAQAGSAPGDIVFAHADSLFAGQQIALQADQRFLGESLAHLINTQQVGTVLLPRATAGVNVPIIDAAPGNAITVASGDEVSGFTVTNPTGAAIFADGVAGNVNINRNTLTGGANGVRIVNSTGTFDVTQTTITNPTGIAFDVQGGSPTVNSTATITNNNDRIIRVADTTGGTATFSGSITDNGGAGILVSNAAGAVNVTGATLNNSTANAIDIQNSSGAITFNSVAINAPTANGVDVVNSNATLNGLTVTNAGQNGFEINNLNTARTVSLTGNTVNGAGQQGIELNVDGTGTLTANVTGNNVTSTGAAFDAATNAAGGLVLDFSNNVLRSSADAGARIDGSAGGPITITGFANNSVPSAAAGGLRVDTATFDASTTTAGIQAVSSGVTTIGSAGNRVQGVGLELDQVQGNLQFGTLTAFNNNGTGLFVRETGGGFTLGSAGGEINTTNGMAIDAGPTTLALTLGSVSSTNSMTNGLLLNQADGSLTIGSTTITDSLNAGLRVENSSVLAANFGNTTISGTGVAMGPVGEGIVLLNNAGSTFTFNPLNVTTDNGTAILATNGGTVNQLAPGTVSANFAPALVLTNTAGQTNGVAGWTFASLSSTNSPTTGLSLVGLTDPFTVQSGSIQMAAGSDLFIDGGNANVTFGANITNTAGRAVEILNRAGGTVAINGSVTDGGAGTGISITSPVAANVVAFNGPVDLGTAANRLTGGTALTINNNGLAASDAVVSFSDLDVFTDARVGVDASNGGTLNITTGRLNTTGAGATAMRLNGLRAGVSLSQVDVDAIGPASPGLQFTNVAGSVAVTGNTTMGATGTIGTGIEITGGDANYSFATTNIDKRSGAGIDVNNTAGTLTFGATTIGGPGAPGVGGIDVSGMTAGSVTLSSVTVNDSLGNGIRLTNNAGDFRVTGNTTINNAAEESIRISQGAGDATFGDVAVTNRKGVGVLVDQIGGTASFGATTISGLGTTADGLVVTSTLAPSQTLFSSVNINGGATARDGIRLAGNQGFFRVTGMTTIDNVAQDGIDLSASLGNVQFGDVLITRTGADGINMAGATQTAGIYRFANVDMSQIAATGLDLTGANATVAFDTLDINGALIGIDLTNTLGRRNVSIANASTIQNVNTGVVLTGADANFTFQNGHIDVLPGAGHYTIDATGLVSLSLTNSGTYNFTGTTYGVGDRASFERSVLYVSQNGTGAANGFSIANSISVINAEAQSQVGDLLIFLGPGPITFDVLGDDTFNLKMDQVATTFPTIGGSVALGIQPVNVLGTFAGTGFAVDTLNGGPATVTTNGAGTIFTVSDNNTISNLILTGGATSIRADTVTGLAVTGTTITGGSTATFDFDDIAGTFSLTGNTVNDSGGRLLDLDGGNAAVTLAGTPGFFNGSSLRVVNTIGGSVQVTGAGISSNGTAVTLDANAAPVTLTDLAVTRTSGNTAFSIDAGSPSGGAITINGASSLDATAGTAFDIGSGSRNINASALSFSNSGTTANNVINVTGLTGGTISFGNVSITSFGNGLSDTAVNLTGSGGTVTFGDLDVGTTVGTGLNASGIALNPGSSSTISANNGPGLILNNVGGNPTFSSVNSFLSPTNGILLSNQSSNVTINSASLLTSSLAALAVNNSSGTITVNNLTINALTGVSLSNNTGTMNFGGMSIVSNGGTGFLATNGGTVNVTGAANTIVSIGNLAVTMSGTTIGASGMTFRSLNGTGISLNDTGSTGEFAVTGQGFLGSGGTLSSTTGSAVSLTNNVRVNLDEMVLTTNNNRTVLLTHAQTGDSYLTLTNSVVTQTGGSEAVLLQNAGLGTLTVLLAGNGFSGVNGNGPDISIFQLNGTTNATIVGNNFPDGNLLNDLNLNLLTVGGVLNTSISGNAFNNANLVAPDIVLNQVLGTFNVTQADEATLESANGLFGLDVDTIGTINFGQPAPPLPP